MSDVSLTNAELIKTLRQSNYGQRGILDLEALDRLEKLADENERLKSRLARYDDQRPITEELLRGMGFKQTQRMEYEHSGMRWLGLGLRVWKCFDGLWTVTLLTDDICGGLPQETHLPNHKQIGQLAHLLDALGVSGGTNTNSNEGE